MEKLKKFFKEHEETIEVAVLVGSLGLLSGLLWGTNVALKGAEIVSLRSVKNPDTGETLFIAMTKNGGWAEFEFDGVQAA